MEQHPQWREVFEGGSAEAEREIVLALARGMAKVQEANRLKAGAAVAARTLHAKAVVAVSNATLQMDDALPADLCAGPYQPGATLPAIIRLSNASGVHQSDLLPDMRGAALRTTLPTGGIHDLLMTSFPASHARTARQFVTFAVIASGPRESMKERLAEAFGGAEAQRILSNIGQGQRICSSFALESFWSRGAILWGGAPVRFQLRPAPDATAAVESAERLAADLHVEFAERLRHGPVRYRFALQRFVDEVRTPIEDGTADWEHSSPPVEVATLFIPSQDLDSDYGRGQADEIERSAFNPWNAPPEFRPLGNLNRARAVVYAESAARWGGSAPPSSSTTSAAAERL